MANEQLNEYDLEFLLKSFDFFVVDGCTMILAEKLLEQHHKYKNQTFVTKNFKLVYQLFHRLEVLPASELLELLYNCYLLSAVARTETPIVLILTETQIICKIDEVEAVEAQTASYIALLNEEMNEYANTIRLCGTAAGIAEFLRSSTESITYHLPSLENISFTNVQKSPSFIGIMADCPSFETLRKATFTQAQSESATSHYSSDSGGEQHSASLHHEESTENLDSISTTQSGVFEVQTAENVKTRPNNARSTPTSPELEPEFRILELSRAKNPSDIDKVAEPLWPNHDAEHHKDENSDNDNTVAEAQNSIFLYDQLKYDEEIEIDVVESSHTGPADGEMANDSKQDEYSIDHGNSVIHCTPNGMGGALENYDDNYLNKLALENQQAIISIQKKLELLQNYSEAELDAADPHDTNNLGGYVDRIRDEIREEFV